MTIIWASLRQYTFFIHFPSILLLHINNGKNSIDTIVYVFSRIVRLTNDVYFMQLPFFLSALTLISCLLSQSIMAGEHKEMRQQELIRLLLADCGSCHGLTLKGGLGPSLLASDLTDKSDELLFAAIHDGRPGTPMPPWANFINDNEISWLIQVLRQEQWKK